MQGGGGLQPPSAKSSDSGATVTWFANYQPLGVTRRGTPDYRGYQPRVGIASAAAAALPTTSALAEARTTVGRVEGGRGGARGVPFPIPAHRTGHGHFEHPALRQISPAGSRTSAPGQHQTCDAKRTEDGLVRQNTRATPGRLASPPQKRANAIGDMVVNRPIGPRPGRVAEVVQPAL
jgi:hypothetical protein